MNIAYNKFLIAFALMVLLGGTYVYFSNGLKAQAALGVSSGLESSVSSDSSADSKIASDTAFLASLTSLTRITIDASIFNTQSFKMLKDNNVKLESVVSGRPNPFMPINSNIQAVSTNLLPVITDDATQITVKSAVLNGTINSALGATNIYFEYGPTQKLGKTTAEAKLSLVGTFVTSIAGLSPKTTYFFRAVARVNKTVLYGDIKSFNTN